VGGGGGGGGALLGFVVPPLGPRPPGPGQIDSSVIEA
jgi:hypothetical protein